MTTIWKKRIFWCLSGAILIGGILIIGVITDVQTRYRDHIVRSEEQLDALIVDKENWSALVLGAGILSNGQPSDALRDRLDVAAWLYQQGRVKYVILTGDDGKFRRDELAVMNRYILSRGVSGSDVIIDGQGYRTYESCKNTKQFSDIAPNMLVITQRFHLSRALYLCNQMNQEAFGIAADLHTYQKGLFFWMRDLLASAKAWWDIHVWTPESPVKK